MSEPIREITVMEAWIEKKNYFIRSIAADEETIAFYRAKANTFKKGTPDRKAAEAEIPNFERSLFFYKIHLKVTEQKIASLSSSEKV